ncbi:hypothetical protein [Gymnodinialimonas ulvae]|uniref:hypothetical protein n=1 Tax=Gymnodinialimonas ulvae TaxID=3126504 RepID=UPI0030A7219C
MLYLGSLDDKTTDYPWTGQRQALSFNQTLLNNLLFGEPCLINDGYIVQSAEALDGIRRPGESSLIEVLVEEGFATILCRSDPTDMLAAMVEGGVASHAALANDPQIQSDMKLWSGKLKDSGAYRNWPPVDISKGFFRLAQLFRRAPEEILSFDTLPMPVFESILADFISEFEEKPAAARTVWERVAKLHCGSMQGGKTRRAEALNEAMNLANELYQFNFAGIMSANSDTPVAVDTRLNQVFFWMMNDGAERAESPSPDPKDTDDPFDIPVASMPWDNVSVDIQDGELAARPFLTEGREEYGARVHFLAARERLFDAPADRAVRRDFEEAVARYDKVLGASFGVGKSTAEIAFETFVDPVAKALDQVASEPMADWADSIAPLLPDDAILVGIQATIQSAPYVATSVSSRSAQFKRSLRSVGRFHPDPVALDYGKEVLETIGSGAMRARDIMTAVTMDSERCTPFYSGVDRFD